MSWRGLWKPEFGEVIDPVWGALVVESLDDLYSFYLQTVADVQALRDCLEAKLDILIDYTREILTNVDLIRQYLHDVERITDLIKFYTALQAPGKGVLTIVVTATTEPKPLYVDELKVRRIIIRVPEDALYLVYIGNADRQDFPLQPAEKLELHVTNPKEVYVRALGEQKIFALFELANV